MVPMLPCPIHTQLQHRVKMRRKKYFRFMKRGLKGNYYFRRDEGPELIQKFRKNSHRAAAHTTS
jgi:hypothetical protein